MSNKSKGKYGEDLACKYLISQGYEIVERNFRYSRLGEIDIIAKKGARLSFVEVKTRTSDAYGIPEEAVCKSKLAKIIMTVQYYISQSKIFYKDYGIDVIAITLSGGANKIQHLKNIQI